MKATCRLRVVIRKRVGHALKRLQGKGVVASRKAGRGALLSWRIAEPDAILEGGVGAEAAAQLSFRNEIVNVRRFRMRPGRC